MTTAHAISVAVVALSLSPLACGSGRDTPPSSSGVTASAAGAAGSAAARSTPSDVSQAAPRSAGTGIVSPASFQGEIMVAVKADPSRKLPTTITYEERGEKVRYTPASGPLSAIADLEAQRTYAIDDASKTYETIDMMAPTKAQPTTSAKLRKTGKTEKVAGLDCEDWALDDGVEHVDVCAWNGAAYIDLASDAKPGKSETSWATALTKERMFPLRLVVHDTAGKELYRAEATKVTPMVISDATFVVPTSYKTADLGSEVRTASLP